MKTDSFSQKVPTHGVQPEYLSDKQVATYLSITRDTVWRWSREGRLPPPIKIGPNSTRWRRSEIDLRLNEVPERESDKGTSAEKSSASDCQGLGGEK